jgi:hypothetical protein
MTQTTELMEQIAQTVIILKGAKKLGVEKRANVLGKLVKAHSELVKTQRTIAGLDKQTGTINAGVIIIPGKSNNWVDEAKEEIDNAHKLIHGDDPEV